MQQRQIGQHLQRAVGSEALRNRAIERRILDLQPQPTVRHGMDRNALNSRHAPPQSSEDSVKPLGVPFAQILDDVGKIVVARTQVHLRILFRPAAHAVSRQVGHAPAHDEVAKCRHTRMVPQSPERVDRQGIR